MLSAVAALRSMRHRPAADGNRVLSGNIPRGAEIKVCLNGRAGVACSGRAIDNSSAALADPYVCFFFGGGADHRPGVLLFMSPQNKNIDNIKKVDIFM